MQEQQTTLPQRRWWTTQDVAERTGLSRNTILWRVRHGLIPCAGKGKGQTKRFDPDTIEAYMRGELEEPIRGTR